MSTGTTQRMTGSETGAPTSALDGRFEFVDQIGVHIARGGTPWPYKPDRFLSLLKDTKTKKEYLLISSGDNAEVVIHL